MPKMKSNRGAKKRLKVSATGKIKTRRAYKSHILTKKSKKRKRNLGYFGTVSKADENNAKLLLASK